MDVTVESVSSMLMLLVVFFVLFVLGLNLVLILRNGLYVPVNCWFCNTNSKVLFANRNSFKCIFCQQYNGFKKNGDYNKEIKEQYDCTENCVKFAEYQGVQPNSNGLCNYCNYNQQLKVLQLANFEPLNKNNYDLEVEHFEQQLEKTYKLCDSCNKVVKLIVQKQNAWLFGNRIKDLKVLRNKISYLVESHSYSFFVKVLKFFLLMCSLSCGCIIIEDHISTNNQLKTMLSNNLKEYVLFSVNIFKYFLKDLNSIAIVPYLKSFLPATLQFHLNELCCFSFLGFFLQTVLLTVSKSMFNWSNINETLSWVILVLTSGIKYHQNVVVFVETIQIFCCLWMIYSYGSTPKRRILKNKFIIKKLQTGEDYYSGDEELFDADSINSSSQYQNRPRQSAKIARANRLNGRYSSSSIKKTDFLQNLTNDSLSFRDPTCYTARKNGLNTKFNLLNIGSYPALPKNCNSSPSFTTSPVNNSTASTNPFFVPNDKVSYTSTKFCHNVSPFNVYQPTYGSQVFSPTVTRNSQAPFSSKNYLYSGSMDKHSENYLHPRSKSGTNKVHSTDNVFGCTSSRFASDKYIPQKTLPLKNASDDSKICSTSVSFYNWPVSSLNNSFSRSSRPFSSCMNFCNSLPSKDVVEAPTFGTNESVKSLDYTFRPLSPQSHVESNRSILSPSKFSGRNLFENVSNPIGGPLTHLHHNEDFYKVSNMQKKNDVSSVLNNRELLLGNTQGFSYNVNADFNRLNHVIDSGSTYSPRYNSGSSRSSSHSSGFISNNELPNAQSSSLPCSRSGSPERNSVFSEPAYYPNFAS